jgi:hypothetical protein
MESWEKDNRINTAEPTKDEIALKALIAGKVPGIDNIPLEILKVGLETSVKILYPLLKNMWGKKTVPEEWKKGLLVKIPKKGDITQCDNWRGLTLLSVPSKVLN